MVIVVVLYVCAGLHLEIDPGEGGEMSIYEKEGGVKPCVHVQILDFRLSETASGTFLGTASSAFSGTMY